MTLLCFLLDLRSLSLPLLRDLKQSLFQLANLYAVSSERAESEPTDEITFLPDRIGLCYLLKVNNLSCEELKIAYRPRGIFSLRDLHHAVNNLPTECFLPETSESHVTGSSDLGLTLARLLSDEALYSWGGKDVLKKLVIIASSLVTNTEVLRKTLMDAAEHCVSVEFVLLEQDQHHDLSEKLKQFENSISDLENCFLRRYFPDSWVLCGLVKRWLQELRNNLEEPLRAVFSFKKSIIGSTKQIFCNLSASSNQIVDAFIPCQTCRCHGHPINCAMGKTKRVFCPITQSELGACDLIENAVRVGEQTVLFLPSFKGLPKIQHVSVPIIFNVIERTNLASLNEGAIVGASYVVTPAACHEMESVSEECDKSELNIQLFHGLCGALFLFDQGLVCSSTCNTETMRNATFPCFYILQPSDKGPMLLRRLAASEEFLPVSGTLLSNDINVPKEIENSIQASLSEIDVRDYNPLLHERGFHPKLNWLVKESLHIRSFSSKQVEMTNRFNHMEFEASMLQPSTTQASEEEEMQPVKDTDEGEWEQLVVILNEVNDSFSPTCISKPKLDDLALPSPKQSNPMDEKTSKILERLEAPKQQKPTGVSPIVASNAVKKPMKKPLLPIDSNSITSSSQPLKPNFQRLKRKQRLRSHQWTDGPSLSSLSAHHYSIISFHNSSSIHKVESM